MTDKTNESAVLCYILLFKNDLAFLERRTKAKEKEKE